MIFRRLYPKGFVIDQYHL